MCVHVKERGEIFSPSDNVLNVCSLVSAMTDNTSVNFVQYKGDYYMSTETNFMNKVDIETLERTEKVMCGPGVNKTDPTFLSIQSTCRI